MTSRGDRSALARYIDLLAGKDAKHSEIASAINAKNPGARVAGPLVGRWRSQQLDVSPGNLAALARAYGRNPLEAFVVAGLLEQREAEGGLDADSIAMLKRVAGDPAAGLPTLAEQRAKRTYPQPAKRAARKQPGKKKLDDE